MKIKEKKVTSLFKRFLFSSSSLIHQFSLFYICLIFTLIFRIHLDQMLIVHNHFVVVVVNQVKTRFEIVVCRLIVRFSSRSYWCWFLV